MLATLLWIASITAQPNLGQQAQGQLLSAKTFVAPGHTSGAAGDGRTDDTEALQQAIDEALRSHTGLVLEPGTYRITKGLVIESDARAYPAGFMIHGQAGPNRNGAGQGGVAIVLDAAATTTRALITVGNSHFRDMIIENIGLVSHVAKNGTPFGVLFAGNGFSHATIRNVSATTVHTAFGIEKAASGDNGEQVDLEDCQGAYVNTFYSNNDGQAYCHHVVNCESSLVNGAVVFKIGNGLLGFSLDAFGFNCSCETGPMPNTFLENDGVSGNLNFWGGRDEAIDIVLAYTGGTPNDSGMILMSGIHFTSHREGYPLIDATLGHQSNQQWTNTFQNCMFTAFRGQNPKLFVKAQPGDFSETFFEKCVFLRFANPITDAMGMDLKIRDCRAAIGSNPRLVDVRN
jgi:hypothetical protein